MAKLAELIATLKFFTIVNAWQGGVHLRDGKVYRRVGPGFWWQWPIRDSIEVMGSKSDTINLTNQVCTSMDGVSVMLSMNVEYKITNVVKAKTSVLNVIDNFSDMSKRFIMSEVRRMTWAQLIDPQTQTNLEDACFDLLVTKTKRWGIKILDVGLTDLAKTFTLSQAQL